MKKEINRTLGNSLRCILPSFWWKRLLGKMVDKIESAESSASSAMKMATLAGLEASDKQSQLVSGSNIKTINHQSILGSGNIIVDTDNVEKYKTKDDLDANGSLAGGDIAAVVDALLVEKSFTECYQPTRSEIETDPYNKKFTKVDGLVLNPDFNPNLISSNYGSLSIKLYSDGKSKGYHKEYPSYLKIECDYDRKIYCWEYDGTSGTGHTLYSSSGFNASKIDRVNNILREGDFRFSYFQVTYREDVNVNSYTSYYSYNENFPADATATIDSFVKMIFAETQNADIYVRSAEWVKLLKEGDVTGGDSKSVLFYMPLNDGLSDIQKQTNAESYRKVVEGFNNNRYYDVKVDCLYCIADATIVANALLTEGRIALMFDMLNTWQVMEVLEDGSATVEEEVAGKGCEIREFYIGDSLTDDQKAWNLETAMMVEEKKCTTVFKVTGSLGILPDGTIIPLSAFVGRTFLYAFSSGVNAAFTTVTIDSDGNSDITAELVYADNALSSTSTNAVQNKVVTAKLTELSEETTHKIGGTISASSASSLSYGYESRIDFSAIKGLKIRLDIDNQSAFVNGKTIAFISDGFPSTIYKQFPFDAFDVELQNDATYVRCSVNPDGVKSVADVAMVMQTDGLLPSSIESLSKSIDALKETFDEALFEIVTPKTENGKYITATGYIGNSQTSCITDFAYVGNTTKVVIENVDMAESRAIVGYDESKSVVASWNEYEDGEVLSIPSNVAYIRLNGFIGVAPIITIQIEHITDKKIELINDRVDALSEEITYQIGEHYSATAATHLSYGYTNRIDHSLNKGTTIHISLDNQSAFINGKIIAFASDGFATVYKQFPFDAFDVELANDMTHVRCSVNPDGVKSVADVAFAVDVFGFLGGKINAIEQKDKDLFKSIARPIITIIDDDTLGYDSVKLFHDVCVQNGIKGTYATLTSIALSDERLIPLMQQYEQEGFHFAIHGKTQSPSYSPEFNAAEAEKDFVEGMRQMQSANFLDWKFFIIPYGAYQPELQQMAKKWGCKCAVGIGQNAYINKSVKVNRFYLPRAGFNAQETGSVTFDKLKALIDEAASNNGWVLVGTHIYDGWTEELLKTKFAEMVQYAKNAGLTFVTLNEGYRQFEPYFTYNEMH